jgi:D-inositol-3-phosphate glycosyltransferase
MSYTVAMLCVHTSPLDLPGQTKDAGGMNVYIRELAQELAQQNTQVDIFTRRTSPETPQIVQLCPGARVIHINAGPVAPIHKNELYQYTPTFARRIDEFRRQEARRYDAVHSHYWLSGVAGMRLACHWKIPHLIMFHTLARLKQLANPQESELPLRLEMEQRLIHHVDRIIASTADERLQMIHHGGILASRIEVIPCGVNLRLFASHNREEARQQLALDTHQPILLFAGRLDPFKGPDILLRAAALMREEAQIVIAGGKPGDQDVSQLQSLAEELGISQRVRFLGARPRAEMPLLYSAADVTVVPSFHESFGLAAVESLACGTPVVATRAGGLLTVIRHEETGFLVSRSPACFAEHLDTLLRDSALAAHMRSRARLSVLQFGWQRVANQMQRLYEELTCKEPCLVAQ